MNGTSLYDYLRKDLPDSPVSNQLVDKLEARYGHSSSVDANTLLEWLYESLYDLMGWRKRHLEEGNEEAAQNELVSIVITNKAISLLEQLAKNSDPALSTQPDSL